MNNAVHEIVGQYTTHWNTTHGFVYDYVTGVITTVDWPDANGSYTAVTGVNSQGVIVGMASGGFSLPAFGFIGTPQ